MSEVLIELEIIYYWSATWKMFQPLHDRTGVQSIYFLKHKIIFCLIKNTSWSNYNFSLPNGRAFDLEQDHSYKMKEERTQLLHN